MSEIPSHRILVLGHSFIWRLKRFMTNSTLPCVEPDFALPPSTLLRFHGVGGRTVPALRRHDLSVVAAFNPTIIVLEIGSNDLCDPNLTVLTLATNILHLINLLHFRFYVLHIIVGEILPRVKTPPYCPNYNARVAHLNHTLLTGFLCNIVVPPQGHRSQPHLVFKRRGSFERGGKSPTPP